MSSHGVNPNPIFFNKKMKSERPEHSLSPLPPTSDNISFLPYLPPAHPHHIPLYPLIKVDVICVSPLSIAISTIAIINCQRQIHKPCHS